MVIPQAIVFFLLFKPTLSSEPKKIPKPNSAACKKSPPLLCVLGRENCPQTFENKGVPKDRILDGVYLPQFSSSPPKNLQAKITQDLLEAEGIGMEGISLFL